MVHLYGINLPLTCKKLMHIPYLDPRSRGCWHMMPSLHYPRLTLMNGNFLTGPYLSDVFLSCTYVFLLYRPIEYPSGLMVAINGLFYPLLTRTYVYFPQENIRCMFLLTHHYYLFSVQYSLLLLVFCSTRNIIIGVLRNICLTLLYQLRKFLQLKIFFPF